MMKKLSYLAAAFVLGVLLSVTINACGGDKENIGPGKTQNPSGGSGGDEPSGSTGREIHNWEIYKLSAAENYNENGQLTAKYDYRYNEKGWEVEYKLSQYIKSSITGRYYLCSVYTRHFTYSPAGDYRTVTNTSISYNEDGSVSGTSRTTGKEYVYQQ